MSTHLSEQLTARQMTPVILSSMLGTAIEWYDFFLYGTMATLVFPTLFFPETNVFVGTLLSFVTFLVGFIARPFGVRYLAISVIASAGNRARDSALCWRTAC